MKIKLNPFKVLAFVDSVFSFDPLRGVKQPREEKGCYIYEKLSWQTSRQNPSDLFHSRIQVAIDRIPYDVLRAKEKVLAIIGRGEGQYIHRRNSATPYYCVAVRQA